MFDRKPNGWVLTSAGESIVKLTEQVGDKFNDPPADLLGKKIGKLAYNVYSTKQFLDQQSPECITWVGDRFTLPTWIRKNYPTVRTPMRTNSALAMLNMTKLGMGVAQLPCVLADSFAQLVPMPVTFVKPGSDLWVLTHIDLRTTARVRIFRDHLVSYLSERKDSIGGKTVIATKHF